MCFICKTVRVEDEMNKQQQQQMVGGNQRSFALFQQQQQPQEEEQEPISAKNCSGLFNGASSAAAD